MPNLNLAHGDVFHAHGIGVVVLDEDLVQAPESAPVPADTYTALLHAYEYLSAQMGPLYRALRDMEQKRDRWRTLTIMIVLAIAGQLIARWVLPQ